MEKTLIAPCGINCLVCGMYQKKKDPCKGCMIRTTRKSQICVIKNCSQSRWTDPPLCVGCAKFPCRRLKQLDRRYSEKTKGTLSIIENLLAIQREGIDLFLAEEEIKWTCSNCGSLLQIGSPICPTCGLPRGKS